ncbi:DUF2332 domain-containing protein [Sphingomonas azotifigens]|uniref:DUF2332 domain-containing protein n=1 Tax=Sphingomonas azotifigens TaxID=330920 RepID=UPI001FE2CF12|nr:DUF2332 family protein [Sphingomonas azotifigens]
MDRIAPRTGPAEIARMARVATDLGSPFVGAVLAAGLRQLGRAPHSEAVITHWEGDAASAALAMRFNAALHFLARRGNPPALAALYRYEHDDFDGAIGEALAAEDDLIAGFLRRTPQTNEVGRSGAIVAALMQVRRRFGLPFELLEIGSSCGLNLNLGRYGFDLGGVLAGDRHSPVQVAPEWNGSAPLPAPLEVVAARGVDLNPLNAADPATCERLMAYIFADQPSRLHRLEEALGMARRHPPEIARGDASEWLARELAEPQAEGVCRVVMHSMVLQYLPPRDRAAVVAMIRDAGQYATPERPLAWVGFEWTETRSEVRLSLSWFPGGEERRVLAVCHPYGNSVDWRG